MSDIADPNPPEIGTAELPEPDPQVEAELERIEENFAASGPLVGSSSGRTTTWRACSRRRSTSPNRASTPRCG